MNFPILVIRRSPDALNVGPIRVAQVRRVYFHGTEFVHFENFPIFAKAWGIVKNRSFIFDVNSRGNKEKNDCEKRDGKYCNTYIQQDV